VIDLGARVARALESGEVRRSLATVGLARAWGAVSSRSVVRSLDVPAHVRAVCVGGATLGGSGKTPLAIACALEYAARGERVALIGHAYRARPHAARVVRCEDSIDDVGDEALVCARALAPTKASVVVGPTRRAAIELATTFADRLILDGVAQTAPLRSHLALLAVDASEPWGADDVPPLGDLRAPKGALLDACDTVVAVADPLGSGSPPAGARVVEIASSGVHVEGEGVSWRALRGVDVGLVTALARGDRIARFLALRGVTPRCIVTGRDHVTPKPRPATAHPKVALWLASAKCASHLPPTLSGIPVATIDYALNREALSWLP
jgi:tetraacyldisaccharide-1-P 4'-kinase